ncbi:P-loop containing nucleoside triphosphate hydrolase protein [Mycena olivaceomarginata]|nr:P-loop containing nucleoside triphosphate hydrolase protein [Mycena olivaceomarginata]
MHRYFSQNKTEQHIFLLYGVGGAGKTQIALKFIEASSWFYIDASTRDTIDAGLQNIALTKAGNTPQDALNWLQWKHNQWLLLFDNADDPEIDLNPFLPQCDHGNIIITSRNPALRFYSGSDAHVSDMEETDAVKLLLARSAQEITPRNEEMAAKIVQELSCLPLAIIQAGAFISESGSLDTYLALYRQNRDQLLSKKPTQSHADYGRTVHTTWQISFDTLSELAQTFLQLCSFLHHQGISEKIFSQAAIYEFPAGGPSKDELQKPMEFLSQYLGPIGDWDSLHFTEITNQLQTYSLIEFSTVTGLFSVHPLVHSWSQSTLTNPEVYHYSMIAIMGMAISAIPETHMQLVQQLVPHIDALRKGQTHVTPDFNMQYGLIYYYAERYRESEDIGAVVIKQRKDILGEDHPETLSAMGVLASVYHKSGQLKKAEELYVVVLKKQQDVLGEDHPDTLASMANIAATYNKMGQFKRAEELYVVVLEKQQDVLGEDHLDTLLVMANLAVTYSKLGDFETAEELEFVVLKKRQDILGDNHPDTLLAMGNLAVTYSELGQFKRAEELEVVVLKKQQDILGEDHPDTLLAMANLAVTYSKLGQYKRAERLEAVVLQKRQDILGEYHPDTLLAMGNLAVTYSELGQFKRAEELEVVVLKKQQDILGEDHPDTLIAMGNLAGTYQKLGFLNKAEELEAVILKKGQDILREDHPDSPLSIENPTWKY